MTQLQSSAAINVDAERKVVQLNEEMRDMLRDLRAKVRMLSPSARRFRAYKPYPLYRTKLTKKLQ